MIWVIYDKKKVQLGLIIDTSIFNGDMWHLTDWGNGPDILVQHYIEAHCELLGIL